MEPPGWTSFCYAGHVVESCPPGVFLRRVKDRCPYCGKEVVGSVSGWGSSNDTSIPVLPIGMHNISYKNEFGVMSDTTLAVYAVERLRIFSEQ